MGSLIIFSQNGTELLLYAVLFLDGFVGDCKRFFHFCVLSFFEKKVPKKAIRDMLVCEAIGAGLAERGKSVPKPS